MAQEPRYDAIVKEIFRRHYRKGVDRFTFDRVEIEDIAEELGVDIDGYFDILKDTSGSRLFSFDEISNTESDGTERIPSDAANPLDEYQHSALKKQVAMEISRLPERERLVLALYYDEEMNLKEIGLVLGVSESRVSQIHSQAALRLRSRLSDWIADQS